MSDYAMFWGCQIPARLPFAEKATRLVLDKLGVSYRDLEGFTCCPYREVVKTADEGLWLATAARNLALAEREGVDIITPCNGCYSTQKEVAYSLRLSPSLKDEINETQKGLGLEYRGTARTLHLLEFLHDTFGLRKLRPHVVAPLQGLRVAVHYGCHLLRPQPALTFDDPLRPTKFDALIEALGARTVDYETKNLCCGQGFNAVEEAENSMELPRLKLRELKEQGVHALVVCCPTCFMQYDYKQAVMQRQGEDPEVAVFYAPELIALCLGYSPEDIGLDLHRSSVEPFLDAWERARGRMAFAREHFELTLVEKCYRCGGCVADCPPAQIDARFDPNAVMGKVARGEVDELLDDKAIWLCIDCYVCDSLCPQRWSMRHVFETLRHLALKEGRAPRGMANALDGFRKAGRLIEPTRSAQAQRQKLGLPAPPPSAAAYAQEVQEASRRHRLHIEGIMEEEVTRVAQDGQEEERHLEHEEEPPLIE